jgi:hypothetical protein
MVTFNYASKHVTMHWSFEVSNYDTCCLCYQKMDYSQWRVFDKRTSVLIAQNCVWPAQGVSCRPLVYAGDLRFANNAVCVSYFFIFIALCNGALSGSDNKRRKITNWRGSSCDVICGTSGVYPEEPQSSRSASELWTRDSLNTKWDALSCYVVWRRLVWQRETAVSVIMAPNYTVSCQRLWCARLFGIFTIKTTVLTPRARCVDGARDFFVPIEGTHIGVRWAVYVTEGMRQWRYGWPVSRLRMSWRFIRTEWETRLPGTLIHVLTWSSKKRLWGCEVGSSVREYLKLAIVMWRRVDRYPHGKSLVLTEM